MNDKYHFCFLLSCCTPLSGGLLSPFSHRLIAHGRLILDPGLVIDAGSRLLIFEESWLQLWDKGHTFLACTESFTHVLVVKVSRGENKNVEPYLFVHSYFLDVDLSLHCFNCCFIEDFWQDCSKIRIEFTVRGNIPFPLPVC